MTAGGKVNGYAHDAPDLNSNGASTIVETAAPSNGHAVNGHAVNGHAVNAGHAPPHENGHVRLADVLSAWMLVSYGTVQRWGRQSPTCDPQPGPTGEGHTPAEFWITRYLKAPPEDRAQIAHAAEAELRAWQRRDPELNTVKTETLEDLKRRIIEEGEGWGAKDVALAMRVTPTLVRNARTEAEREPEYGRPDGSLAHARELRAEGLSLRQIAVLTGIPKSTLADQFRALGSLRE
jgi:hypothetical protein